MHYDLNLLDNVYLCGLGSVELSLGSAFYIEPFGLLNFNLRHNQIPVHYHLNLLDTVYLCDLEDLEAP